nr:pentapeptide repeat-containing protein [Streptomyces sp. SID5476]
MVRVWIVAPITVLGSVGAGWLIYRFVVDPLVANTADAIKLTLAILTLTGAVLAGVYAYRKQRLAESDAHRADANQFADRYTTAAEQLGHDKAAVRLAGAYALARLADDWEEQCQVCIDVLCAYLRMPYQTNPNATNSYKEGEREVRHTVIRLIRDHLRLPPAHPNSWQGLDFDFTAVLFDGGDLSSAQFSGGRVSFTGAQFSGGAVRFDDATFSGSRVHFDDAMFSDGLVHFDDATFSGGTVRFDDATFSGSTVRFDDATFSGASVDLRSVASWATPPRFNDWVWGNPPAGLLLPSPSVVPP